jgi:hypothetical protein
MVTIFATRLTAAFTELANGVLLCGYHHTTIHQGDWVIQLAADRRPDFYPPTWIDPDRQPRRHAFHQHQVVGKAPMD